MTKNEIKKALYKQKPIAHFDLIRIGVAYYSTAIENLEGEQEVIQFQIPISDMGEADFESEIPANLLNRWIIAEEK